MCEKIKTIPLEMHAKATESLQEEVEQEMDIPDPEKSIAKEIINSETP